MSGRPDFLHELDARRHAIFNLALYFGVLLALLAAMFLIPGAKDEWWWLWGLAIIGGGNLIIFVVLFAPSAVRGGTYRVVVRDDRLRVESPHRIFGRSFEMALPSIARLVIRKTDGPDRHEIQTNTGQTIPLDNTFTGRRHVPAKELFEVIRRLHPEIHVETRDW